MLHTLFIHGEKQFLLLSLLGVCIICIIFPYLFPVCYSTHSIKYYTQSLYLYLYVFFFHFFTWFIISSWIYICQFTHFNLKGNQMIVVRYRSLWMLNMNRWFKLGVGVVQKSSRQLLAFLFIFFLLFSTDSWLKNIIDYDENIQTNRIKLEFNTEKRKVKISFTNPSIIHNTLLW